MDNVVNLKLMAHPMNWLIVLIVVAIGSFAFREVHRGLTNCSCGNQSPD